jgi:hypothetical protein
MARHLRFRIQISARQQRYIFQQQSGSGLLHQAAAYHAALLDGALCPSSIVAANNNLGNALVVIGERENSIVSLKEAACGLPAALEAPPENAAPLDAARTQINLAYTLGDFWNRTQLALLRLQGRKLSTDNR